jgi:hypothetical protein
LKNMDKTFQQKYGWELKGGREEREEGECGE